MRVALHSNDMCEREREKEKERERARERERERDRETGINLLSGSPPRKQ